jgi:hypothetical protein
MENKNQNYEIEITDTPPIKSSDVIQTSENTIRVKGEVAENGSWSVGDQEILTLDDGKKVGAKVIKINTEPFSVEFKILE